MFAGSGHGAGECRKIIRTGIYQGSALKVKDLVTALNAKFGENIKIGRMKRFEI